MPSPFCVIATATLLGEEEEDEDDEDGEDSDLVLPFFFSFFLSFVL